MADKVLKALDTKINSLGDQIQNLDDRKRQAEARAVQVKAEIPEVMQALKDALASGDDLISLDARRKDLKEEAEMLQLSVDGISEKIEGLEDELSRTIEQRNARFAELASVWLGKEAATYNQLVEQLTESLKRIHACREYLWELGEREAYKAALGPAWEHLGSVRLPTLANGFTVSRDLHPGQTWKKFRPGPQDHEAVFQEVINAR